MKKTMIVIIAACILTGCAAPKPKPCEDSVSSALLGAFGFSVCGPMRDLNSYF